MTAESLPRASVALLAIAFATAAAARGDVRWRDVEPLLLERGPWWSQDAPPPARGGSPLSEAIADVTDLSQDEAVAVLVRLTFARCGPDSEPTCGHDRFVADAIARSVLGRAVAEELAERGLRCSDCAPAATRGVMFGHVLPELVRVVDLLPEDVTRGDGSFRACSGNLTEPEDRWAAALAYAAMFRLLSDSPVALERVKGHAEAATRGRAAPIDAAAMTAVNSAFRERLRRDTLHVAALREVVALEAPAFGMRCVDCSEPTTVHRGEARGARAPRRRRGN